MFCNQIKRMPNVDEQYFCYISEHTSISVAVYAKLYTFIAHVQLLFLIMTSTRNMKDRKLYLKRNINIIAE